MPEHEKIVQLEQKIDNFTQKQQALHQCNKNDKNCNYFYIIANVIADIVGGILTAFILNKIYENFFGKNTIIFTLLLIVCGIAGIYNAIKLFYKK